MLKVSIIQHAIRYDALQGHLSHLSQLLRQQSGSQLYVLTETFATGFMSPGSAQQAAQQSPLILGWMQQQARQLNAAIAGSVATPDETGLLRNRFYFVRPDGTYSYYDKRHLFSYAGEQRTFQAGRERVVVTWGGVRFLLQVCYDLRFPVFSRNHGDYDAIIYVANWPQQRIHAWQSLLTARAIENQCYVIGVNRVGSDHACHYDGHSVVIDAYGRPIAQCPPDVEATASAQLDINELNRFRQKFPVLNDADGEVLLEDKDYTPEELRKLLIDDLNSTYGF